MTPDSASSGKRPSLPRLVIIFGVVSLLMDVASEMLYPIGPIFLTTVLGASAAWVGIIEGLAEAVAGLLKGYSGALSDGRGARKPFVTLGYSLSALAKPFPGLSATIGAVLGTRLLDRVGKGIRTAPRDALIAHYTPPEMRGAAFGYHRAMDTLGAAIGPTLALIYLSYHPGGYSTLYLIAFVPAALAAIATTFVHEKKFVPVSERKPGIRQSLRFWREAPPLYRRVLILLTLFALINSSDVFLILRAREIGLDNLAIEGYIGYNVVYAIAAFPAGWLSDKVGRRGIIAIGMFLFALVYAGFALMNGVVAIWGLFGLYGIYSALTESVAKAWVSGLVPNAQRGQALGLMMTLASLASMLASFWTGVLWTASGSPPPLLISAGGALVAGLGVLTATGRKGDER